MPTGCPSQLEASGVKGAHCMIPTVSLGLHFLGKQRLKQEKTVIVSGGTVLKW